MTIITSALGLAQFAPSIIKWLAGNSCNNAEKIAQEVIDTAKNITKLTNVEDAKSAIQNNNQLMLDFQKEILKIDTRLELLSFKDKQSARARDFSFIQRGSRNLRADVMVISAAVGLIMCLAALAFYAKHLPGEATGIISTIAGIFGACLKDAYAFEFGSSRGSKEKDINIASIIQGMG